MRSSRGAFDDFRRRRSLGSPAAPRRICAQELLIIVAAVRRALVRHDPPAAREGRRRSSGCSAPSRPGDEILTVGGIYGIVQELEPDEDGGDLVVEIAEGIHVRIARKALATVIKPEDDDDEDEDEDAEPTTDDVDDGEAENAGEAAELRPA